MQHMSEAIPQDVIVPREYAVFSSYLSTEEIAKILNVSVQAVRRWCEVGDLPASRFGRLFRVKTSDLEAFVAEGEQRCRKAVAEKNGAKARPDTAA